MLKDLTAIAVANAKPRDKRYELPDAAARGLRLVVQPTGAKSWAVRYRRKDGSTAKLTLGPHPAIDLKTARGRALEAVAAVAAGFDPGETKKASKVAARAKAKPTADETTGAAIELFISRHGKVKNRESVWREAQRILDRTLAPWAQRCLSEVTARDVHAILDDLMDRGSPIMANRTLAVLRSFFRYAVERHIISASPCAGIGAPAPTKARERVLDEAELVAVWRAAKGLGHPFSSITRLLVLTGQRRGEVGGIEETDIDLNSNLWTIPANKAKNGKTHVVHLAPSASAILREAVERDRVGPMLFGAERPPSGWSKAKRRLDTLVGSAVCEPWVLHDIRRSVATGLARNGVAIPVVEKVLNHSSGTFAGVVGIYQRHDFLEERKAALTEWAEVLTRLTS